MFWRILPHATVSIASGALILLDIRLDRYFRIPSRSAALMKAWLKGEPTAAPPEVLRLLADNRIVGHGDPAPANTSRERVEIPCDLISPCWTAAGAPTERRSVIIAQVVTRFLLRTRALEAILRDRSHAHAGPPVDPEHLRQRCAIFARSRAFSPFAHNCLLDTLSLARWLGADARDCVIVFGVTAHPFTAHCWLQSRHVVMNDSFDHVSRHTPILVI